MQENATFKDGLAAPAASTTLFLAFKVYLNPDVSKMTPVTVFP